MNLPVKFKLLSHDVVDWPLFSISELPFTSLGRFGQAIKIQPISALQNNKFHSLPKEAYACTGQFTIKSNGQLRGVRVLRRFRAKLKKMDCEAERILQISMQKLTDAHQRRCLGPSLRRNLLVPRVLNSVLSSTELSYCAYRTEYKIDVDIDGVKNELLPFDPSKITVNQKSTEVKKTGNDRKRSRPDVDAVQKKRFKTMTTSFFYGDVKITITDEYFLS